MQSSDINGIFAERRADDLMIRGLAAVESGDYVSALHEFKAAAYVVRTAEALTHWGEMEHHLGDTKRAIELCKEAIEVDPDCGDPYNDIGSYLAASGKLDDAIEWFERAIASKHNFRCQFSHSNLGRIYFKTKRYEHALFHFEKALEFQPDDPDMMELVRTLREDLDL